MDATCVRWSEDKSHYDSFLNKKIGFKQLLKWVKKLKQEDDRILFCMEHTGHYAQNLVLFLKANGFDFAQINPLKIKRSMGLRREKSDKADSKAIAMYGLKFQEDFRINIFTDAEFLDLQLLLAHRKRLQSKKLAFQRQSTYLKHCLSNHSAKKIIKDLLRYQKYFDKELKNTDKKIDQFIANHPQLKQTDKLLQSIPGIGRIISLYSILYTKNFEQISCPRKFACYCGVAPFKNESGTSVRKGTRVSFYANRMMKSILNFGAMNAIQNDPELKAYYLKKTEQKSSKMLVLNAVRNKLIHRMFAVIKRKTPYVVRKTF